jgi:hypothetical protein
MSEFTRIAVTVPTETYTLVERLRRRLGKSRSAVVALALEEWLRSADTADADRRYVEGYARIPEAVDDIGAVAAQATSYWDTWAPGAPLRAADSGRPRPPLRAQRSAKARARAPGRSRR